ncbi:hypothetical protein BDL97_07G095800 [Sphagnum fallax]|nr:hypothetical protein BDL97_07G095800 [Sphagnum fallax]
MLPPLRAGAHRSVAWQTWRHLQGESRVSAQRQWRSFASKGEEGSMTYLRNNRNGAQLYLVGTAHVSEKSAEEVREVIHQVKPDTVAVELCAERAKKMLSGESTKAKSFFQQLLDMLHMPGGLDQKLISFWLKSMYELIRSTGVEPGKEFRVAMEEAQRLNANVLYVDQDVQVTMKRLRDVITLRDIIKIIMTNSNPNIEQYPTILKDWEKNDFQGSVERLKTRETVRQLISWMEAAFPDVVKVMVHERDALMVKRLRACEGKVVGVVGMAHMDGIERLWKDADS